MKRARLAAEGFNCVKSPGAKTLTTPARQLCSAPYCTALLFLCSVPVWSGMLCPVLVCSFAPLCSALGRQLQCFILNDSDLYRETQSSVFSGKEKYTFRARRELLIWTKVTTLDPWLFHPHPHDNSKSSQFGPKGTVLIGQNWAILNCQWRTSWEYSCATLTGWRKPQSH